MSLQSIQQDNYHFFDTEALLTFLGGFFGGLSHAIRNQPLASIIFEIQWSELLNYGLRSLIGGVIGLGLKLAYDMILRRTKKKGANHE